MSYIVILTPRLFCIANYIREKIRETIRFQYIPYYSYFFNLHISGNRRNKEKNEF